jgi:cysteine desulfurase
VAFPHLKHGGSLLDKLAQLEIYVSGGSACSNLTQSGSHVLKNLKVHLDRDNVRFSFSKHNTPQEIRHVVKVLNQIYQEDEGIAKSKLLEVA